MATASSGSKAGIYEGSYLYLREYTCPVCGAKLKVPTVKSGKARMIGQDWDLRPIHKDIDTLKYDVVHCNKCGYAVLRRYFSVLPKPHKDMILQKISVHYTPIAEPVGMVLNYDEALVRYKLALICAVARKVHDSELGLISLKMAWLNRAKKLELGDDAESMIRPVRIKYDQCQEMEEKYLQKAMEFFVSARQTEEPPIAGMNEIALDFLLASLCGHFEKYDDATRLVSGIIQSKQSSGSQKDRARDMLDSFRQKKEN